MEQRTHIFATVELNKQGLHVSWVSNILLEVKEVATTYPKHTNGTADPNLQHLFYVGQQYDEE